MMDYHTGNMCGSCRFFRESVMMEKPYGHCQKHAPTQNGSLIPAPPGSSPYIQMPRSQFPVVWDTNWCGDYESRKP